MRIVSQFLKEWHKDVGQSLTKKRTIQNECVSGTESKQQGLCLTLPVVI